MNTFLKVTDTLTTGMGIKNRKRKHIKHYVPNKNSSERENITVDFINMSDNWMISGWWL